jgi:hypothetical protein
MMPDTTPTNDFKDTEIGPIPADWGIAELGEFCQCKGGYAFPHEYQGKLEGSRLYPFGRQTRRDKLS